MPTPDDLLLDLEQPSLERVESVFGNGGMLGSWVDDEKELARIAEEDAGDPDAYDPGDTTPHEQQYSDEGDEWVPDGDDSEIGRAHV